MKNRQRIIAVLLVIVGLINLAPVVGVLGTDSLSKLYGLASLEGDLLILMRHRALLFGILGVFIICSAFKRQLQPAAMLMTMVSMLGYILLLFISDKYGAELFRVAIVDAIACLPLVLAIILYGRNS
ncbi:MAG: hypothetical protein SH820_13840 [Xanthomonadales bacterium]|nr:hypothetical protein [Xanthomonadales bacterium]